MRAIQVLHIVAVVVVVAAILFYVQEAKQSAQQPSDHSRQAIVHADNAKLLQARIDSLNALNAEQERISLLLRDSLDAVHVRYQHHHARVRSADMAGLQRMLDSLSSIYIINRQRYRLLLDGGTTPDSGAGQHR